ncbi:hypothetical protein LJ754_08020 [Arthrobacter sp. zg-Y40]|uniref:hypothetical protein n=1 Tax=Arthrobacter sp. zg-Y40 TaxID=2886939 RepID=UPI001D1510B4|nr:hypothetical protein [Arthrobacter sp. zg-Y40]MCC3279096.1 hypothetical protein [Arthrobacter sp. zg-Y40]
MGDHWEQLLDLSVDGAGAEDRLQEVRNWLSQRLDQGGPGRLLMSVISRISDWDQGGTEPLLTCTGCSWTALLGDWKISSCMAVTHLAVIIDHTWSNLADPLMEALRTDLGGRWAYVHRHL